MKYVRKNPRHRKKHSYRATKRHALILGSMAAIVLLITLGIVSLVLLFQQKPGALTPSNPPQIDSQMVSIMEPVSSAGNPEAAPAYQSQYPDLYVPVVEKVPTEQGDKVVYLTYDDGPSALTPELLDVLDQEDVKATFFVMAQGKSTEDCKKWIKMIADRGHTLGVHTYTHEYKQIYASPQAFLDDFKKMHDLIYDATGQKVTMFRFAGGSVNSYNQATCKAIIEEMLRRGYTYFDWNVDSGDSNPKNKAKDIYSITVSAIKNYNKSIVLMHNSKAKSATVQQTAAIIREAKKAGYRFDVLDPSVKPFTFRIPEPSAPSTSSSASIP